MSQVFYGSEHHTRHPVPRQLRIIHTARWRDLPVKQPRHGGRETRWRRIAHQRHRLVAELLLKPADPGRHQPAPCRHRSRRNASLAGLAMRQHEAIRLGEQGPDLVLRHPAVLNYDPRQTPQRVEHRALRTAADHPNFHVRT